jgi:phosphatidate cytidylyltransferase
MKRLLTAIIGIPLVLAAIVFSPDWLLALIVAAFAALALDEFLDLGRKCAGERAGRWFLLPGALVTASFFGGADWVLTLLTCSALLVMCTAVFRKPLDKALPRIAIGLAGLVYCCITLGFLILLPREFVLLLLVIIWSGDSAAYYGGRLFGKHLLASGVSPKKTVEGGVAGLLVSTIAGIAFGMWLLGEAVAPLGIGAAVVAVAGQVGDLAESAFKRSAGVKDSSSILPGHGGILDRLDSLFFATPVFYWLFT